MGITRYDRRMDISQIRTLIHVAELGSVSRAADRLGIAQPALSRQIRQLEAELGGALFVRHGRGMMPTALGWRILQPAGEILGQIEVIRRHAADGGSALSGRVRLGLTATVAEVVTVALARLVRAEHPDLSLCLSSAYSGHLLDWLKRGELDCCIGYDPEVGGAVRTRPVLMETLLLVGAPARGLGMSTPVPFEALAREPLVLPSPHHGLRRIADACAMRAGIQLTPAIEADSFGGMIDLVRNGFGSTILPLAPIHTRIAAGALTAAPLVDPIPSRRVLITYPADRAVTPAARYVGEAFAKLAGALVAQGIWAGHMLV